MHRTQLYLDDDLWAALRAQARRAGTTISDLVRKAARQQYMGSLEERRRAMEAWVGARKNRKDMQDPTEYVRGLRRGDRLERLHKQ